MRSFYPDANAEVVQRYRRRRPAGITPQGDIFPITLPGRSGVTLQGELAREHARVATSFARVSGHDCPVDNLAALAGDHMRRLSQALHLERGAHDFLKAVSPVAPLGPVTFEAGELMAGKAAKDQAWAEAARRCQLSPTEVRMAKELGFTPRSLLKSIPSKAEPWKAPVADWVRDLYEKRQRRTEQRRQRRERALGTAGSAAPAPSTSASGTASDVLSAAAEPASSARPRACSRRFRSAVILPSNAWVSLIAVSPDHQPPRSPLPSLASEARPARL